MVNLKDTVKSRILFLFYGLGKLIRDLISYLVEF